MEVPEVSQNQQGLDLAYSKINELDLEPVVKRMMHVHFWPRKKALIACDQYRNYLYLCKKYIDEYDLPPSYEIDEIWHNHILCTRKYQREIMDIFGYFLHHDPHHGNNNELPHSKLVKSFNLYTQELYKEEFGEYLYSTKPNIFEKVIMWVKFKLRNPYTAKTVRDDP